MMTAAARAALGRAIVGVCIAATIATGVAACKSDKTDAQAVPGAMRPAATQGAASGGTTRESLALGGTTTCDTLARLIMVPSIQVLAAASDSSLPDPMSNSPGWRRGCGVQLKDSTDTTGAPIQTIEQWLTSRGWEYGHVSADGPDGEVIGYAGHGRLCVIRGSWDGGDDSDSTVVPAPGYELSIACAPMVPADTVGNGKMRQDELEMQPRIAHPMVGAIAGAHACPVPGSCGIAPPVIPPAAMIDLQHMISAARLRTTTWPAAGPLPLVDTVAKHGRAIARAIAAMLPTDSASTVEWNVHVEQQLELTLCSIYGIKPQAGITVWGASAGQAANRAVRQYWRDRVRSGS